MDDDKSSASRLYTNAKYSSQFFTELKRLFSEGKLTDVILLAGDANSEAIACHKVILAALSPYFVAMFSSNLLEAQTSKVFMPNVDHAALVAVVHYAYSGSISLNVLNVQSVLMLATLLQVRELEAFCCDFMRTQLDIYNCIEIYSFAKRYSHQELVLACQEFIGQHFGDLMHKTNEFVQVSDVTLLCDMLSLDELDVSSEKQVLDAACKWINHAQQERSGYFARIFDKCFRLALLDEREISAFLQEQEQLLSQPGADDKKQVLIDYLLSNTTKPQGARKRAGMTKADTCFLLVGGNCDLDDGLYVNCFNPLTGDKFLLSRGFHDHRHHKRLLKGGGFFHVENPGVCVTDENRIFVCGGNYVYHAYKTSRNNTPMRQQEQRDNADDDDDDHLNDQEEILSKELYEYDNAQDAWIRRANMLFCKTNFSLCAMDKKLYAFGGITKDQDQLDIVESYDIEHNKWDYVGTMPTPFIAGCVVRHQDAFYVLGGRSGVGRFNNCFRFVPETREWSELSAMRVGRFNFGACVTSTRIYVFGGQRYDESEHSYYTREALDSVEVYDFAKRQWTECAARMPSPLYNTGVCVLSDKCIYVCGTTECKYSGNTLFGFMFTSVFRLDLLDDTGEHKWTVVEHDVSDIKVNYRAVAAKINTRKLHKCLSGQKTSTTITTTNSHI